MVKTDETCSRGGLLWRLACLSITVSYSRCAVTQRARTRHFPRIQLLLETFLSDPGRLNHKSAKPCNPPVSKRSGACVIPKTCLVIDEGAVKIFSLVAVLVVVFVQRAARVPPRASTSAILLPSEFLYSFHVPLSVLKYDYDYEDNIQTDRQKIGKNVSVDGIWFRWSPSGRSTCRLCLFLGMCRV
ncbi:hypothetical protein ASPZODRAFT_516546 [Penicilliopsis zonata CBS 506.65]|uniref:Uncharacterized protein n=1 Tax=Penicilliopsis zonata CBS 506.65 TaxID=1073090 RepID=A0A1L9SEZ8_9EURO|nr:hypothetical protein ASPZODRAFT_516546 [Penicilliopsis zonata CBS 506.65]OJJ45718.1 hypothetical protein ASPZODRAFT_516546 [Penicilliopsis zonata CBS 506.65]